ncbi:MAG: hypothetical protein AB1772_05335 [Candidatus Zixiibacteriota bacterium]
MKKLVLGIFLLAVIVAVVYLQVTRDSERQEDAFRKGYRTGADSVVSSQPDYDSLAELIGKERQALAEYRTAMADSLVYLDTVHRHTIDSLERRIDAQRADLSRLKQKAQAGKTAPGMNKSARPAGETGARHEEILNYYRRAMAHLPSDLSAYEYQVAVTEVRTETATKFSISVDRLNEIRKQHHVDF